MHNAQVFGPSTPKNDQQDADWLDMTPASEQSPPPDQPSTAASKNDDVM